MILCLQFNVKTTGDCVREIGQVLSKKLSSRLDPKFNTKMYISALLDESLTNIYIIFKVNIFE